MKKPTDTPLLLATIENDAGRMRAHRLCALVPEAALAEMEFCDVLELERTFFGRAYSHHEKRDDVFASLHGVTPAAMTKYIAGSGNPDPKRALAFCRATGIDIAERWLRIILIRDLEPS